MIKEKKRRLKLIRLFLLIAIAAIIIIAVFSSIHFSLYHDYSAADESSIGIDVFVIPSGATLEEVADALFQKNLINSPKSFLHYIRRNLPQGIRNGEYLLSANMTIPEISQELYNGLGHTMHFTINEGQTLASIAQTFSQENIMAEDIFWQTVRCGDFSQYPFLADRANDEHRLEGFLFPGDYIIPEGCTPEEIFIAVLDRFTHIINALPETQTGLNIDELVILASLVEAETNNDEERPLIASVYFNRLQTNMYLQCDSTILYAMPVRKKRLYFADYQYPSIYNTYLYKGLPPTAICSPGIASLAAANAPMETDYFYYLLKTDGSKSHAFAATYDQHVENRRQYGYNK